MKKDTLYLHPELRLPNCITIYLFLLLNLSTTHLKRKTLFSNKIKGLLTFCRKKGANSVNNDLHLLTAMM